MKTISGAEFKAHFADLVNTLHDTDQVYFGSGDLSFNRVKDRGAINGPRLVQIEFNEIYSVTLDPSSEG